MGNVYQDFLLMLHDVRTRRLSGLVVAAALCLLGWGATWFVPNRYESEARVYAQVENLLPEKIGVSTESRQRLIGRLKRTLTSTVTIDRLYRDPEVAVFMPHNERAVDTILDLRRAIEVVEQQENLFRISARVGFRHLNDQQNAQLARLIVQKLIDIFVSDNLSGGRNESDVSLRFMDQQIVGLQAKMRAANAQRAQYELSMFGQMSGTGTVEEKIADARKELADVESDLMAAQMAFLTSNNEVRNGPVPAPGQNNAVSASARLTQLLSQLNDARTRGLTDNHPDIILLLRQIARARTEVGPGVQMLLPGAAKTVAQDQQAMVASLIARRTQLRRQIAMVTQALARNPEVLTEQQRMVGDYTALQEQYATLVQKREALRLQDQVFSTTDAVSFRVIDPPALPKAPVLPDRTLLLAAVALIAGGVAPLAAFAQSRIRKGFATPQVLMAATGLVVIAGVPESETFASRSAALRKTRLFWLGCALLAVCLVLLIFLDLVKRGAFA